MEINGWTNFLFHWVKEKNQILGIPTQTLVEFRPKIMVFLINNFVLLLLIGYMLLCIVLWLVCVGVAYLLVLPIVEDFYSPVIQVLKDMW